MINTETLQEIINKINFVDNNLNTRENLIKNFTRLKKTTPFSIRLNAYIINWYMANRIRFEFTDTDYFDDMSPREAFNKMKEDYSKTGKIKIWTGSSDNTIFGDETVNVYFRAWHDYTHLMINQDFSFAGETAVAIAQAGQLPDDFIFEKELIMCEIVGQNLYYRENKEYCTDQRVFTHQYLINPINAIKIKQSKFIDLRKSKIVQNELS